jgi:nitrite reductase/ring-hydroxylating ferredoxin subunit
LTRASDEPAGDVVARVGADRVKEGSLTRIDHPPFHLLVTRVDGCLYAIEDTCPHSGRSLCEGHLTGHVVTCPGHGWEIDVRTGEVLTAAGLGERAPVLGVREVDGTIEISDRRGS